MSREGLNLAPQAQRAVDTLARRFFPDHAALRLLHRGQGMVLEVARQGPAAILKVLPSATSSVDMIQARVDWIAYLYQHGLRVPALIASAQGRLVEQVEIEARFYAAYAYEKLPLDEANRIDWRDAAMPVKLGQVMGTMHALARAYRPTPGRPRVECWDTVQPAKAGLAAPRAGPWPANTALFSKLLSL